MLVQQFRSYSSIISRQYKHAKVYASLPSVHSNSYSSEYQPVADFYAGKSVFITGGTGFLGKTIIEKLLRSCSDVDKIYLMIREKKGVSAYDRMERIMFENPVFAKLKASNPEAIKKIVPIIGDMAKPGLGINAQDEQTLIDQVSVVLHSAATVKFNEPLPVAMNINFKGTQKILNLCQRIKNMKGFVYISTAFAHTQNRALTETIYPAPNKIEDVYKFMEDYGHDETETKKFIRDKPNTYTYSKAQAETYIAENFGDIPTAIVRPSSVISAKNEPIVGWLDNWYGATATLHSTARGWNRIIMCNPTNRMDLIPVDYVSNMIIVAAARAGNTKDLKIYNCATSSANPITWGQVFNYFMVETAKRRKHEIPFPTIYYTNSKVLLNIFTTLFQVVPAHLADLCLRMRGKEPKFVSIMDYVLMTRRVVQYFSMQSWVMKAGEARALAQSLSTSDKKTFPCDPAEIDWSLYIPEYWKGTFKYLYNKYKL